MTDMNIDRISKNAEFISQKTPPQPEDAAWDDPEEWVLEAARLAHDVMDLIKYFQQGGEIPAAWRLRENQPED